MEKLYLDVGNTSFTLAERSGNGWRIVFRGSIKKDYKELKNNGKINRGVQIITGSVRKDINKLIHTYFSDDQIQILKTEDIPKKNINYQTPETLGIDRFLTCLGAVSKAGSGAIVIDAGSACTIDYMTLEKVYQGGVIMPGIQLFHQAVKDGLPELPAVDRKVPDQWPGKSTKDCLRWGVNGVYLQSIERFVEKIKNQNSEAAVFTTGGDAEFVSGYLKRRISVHHNTDLIFDGMAEFEKLFLKG